MEKALRALLVILLLLIPSIEPVRADEVVAEHDGFELLGALDLAAGAKLKKGRVVLLLHDLLGSDQSVPVADLKNALLHQKLSVLAINLSLGHNRRTQGYSCDEEQNHRYEDALPEIHAWVRWLQKRGVRDITLAGFGRGANQIALYASKTTQKAVKRVVLISPTTWDRDRETQAYQRQHGKSLIDLMFQIEEDLADTGADSLLEGVGFLQCQRALVTARTFASYYRDRNYLDAPALIPLIKRPTLVIAAELDHVSPDLVSKLQQVEARPDLRLDIIEGSDRQFAAPFTDRVAGQIKLFADDTAK
jgi:pimeloyl-ACP methyl ester carboxylesterase